MLKAKVLDIAVKQISEHADLSISYTLEKKSRAFKNVIFTVKPQAVDVMATLPGLGAQPNRYRGWLRIRSRTRAGCSRSTASLWVLLNN